VSATRAYVIRCDTPGCRMAAVLTASTKSSARLMLTRAGWRARHDAADPGERPAILDRCPTCVTTALRTVTP